MRTKPPIIIGLGELLWDCLPGGKKLGGAPANFAYHAAILGNHGMVATRVGNDALGQEALAILSGTPVDCSAIQYDATYQTGRVDVSVDQAGHAFYTFADDCAWDHLEYTEEWERLARTADAVCFGTLAQRSPQSKDTIEQFLDAVPRSALRIFDVNLRGNFYTDQTVLYSLASCNVLKLNEQELPVLAAILDLPLQDERWTLSAIRERYDLRLLCYTRSDRGSCFVTEHACCDHAGFRVKVGDTVGAGDAFTAAVADGMLRDLALEEIAQHASMRGAWVAMHHGAMPAADTFDANQLQLTSGIRD